MKASPEPRSVGQRLARLIADSGPISVAHYMAEANAHYYAGRDPLGAAGDFVTAPEISQMFGELVGVWLADLWDRAGRPENACYVELGPGRGTLAVDALRAMRAAGFAPAMELVETSPALRAAQRARLPAARWHDGIDGLPADRPLLIVANEFFDALPIRQIVATGKGWRERKIGHDGASFVPAAGLPVITDSVPAAFRAAPAGTVIETAPAAAAIMRGLAERLAKQGGAALVVDYGHERTSPGETLQAVSRHRFADPWRDPGERDLTAHVDFEALGDAARAGNAQVHGPIAQGAWLQAMGIEYRAAVLATSAPARAEEIDAARRRLTAPDQMGRLFKAMAVTAPGWPTPAGFA